MQQLFPFSNVNWGSDEARGDENLSRYFVSFPGMERIEAGDIRYIIGRKGMGKTAVFEYLRQKSQSDPLSFYRTVSLRNFPLALMRQLEDKRLAEKSKYVPVWRYVLLIELCAMIAENESPLNGDVKREIQEFLSANFDERIGSVTSLTVLKERGLKLGLSNSGLGFEYQGKVSQSISGDIHYQKVCDIIESKLLKCTGEFRYFLFLDELDEGYRSGDSSLRLILLALLRAVEDIAIAFRHAEIKVLPMVALRSDIWNGLNDNDLNKYHDALIKLSWNHSESNDPMSLRRIVNSRIEASLGVTESRSEDWWPRFVQDVDKQIPFNQTLWRYMIAKTHDRPRDILKFLKLCNQAAAPHRLMFRDVDKAERAYSNWLYDELKNEGAVHIAPWKEVLDCISRIGRVYLDDSETLLAEFQRDRKITDWLSQEKLEPRTILEELFNLGVIGLKKRNDYFVFKYKNEDAYFDSRDTIVVQFGLIRKLSLR